MGKVWVLDTDTKGTGAEMVPLDKVLERPAPSPKPFFVPPPKTAPPAPEEPAPRAPRAFKIVEVTTHEVLAEGADPRATLALLKGVRSSVDVEVFVWEPEDERWRLLTLGEQRALWDLRDRG
jgi:hypothetical protein